MEHAREEMPENLLKILDSLIVCKDYDNSTPIKLKELFGGAKGRIQPYHSLFGQLDPLWLSLGAIRALQISGDP